MKKLVFVIIVAAILSGCFSVGPEGQLQLDVVTLTEKFVEDASGD